MSNRIIHLFMIFVISFCLSLPMTASAKAEVGADGTEPIGTPAEQCPTNTQQDTTSTATIDAEGQSSDEQSQESAANDCTEWQTAPVSWNS